KYLCGKVEYGWKGYMRKYLIEGGGCGEEAAFMVLKKPKIEEVFTAWAEFVLNVNYECENINHTISQSS
ncbi:hypothetical protein Q8G71_35910, partial [Klebsiella pneumoniae]